MVLYEELPAESVQVRKIEISTLNLISMALRAFLSKGSKKEVRLVTLPTVNFYDCAKPTRTYKASS